ncbi:hypothetical protein, partial [Bradyrhizobium sp. USDA 3456]|uniref:hypothetical protein n=1 Tax=Bradyrhizobium sp. USDA 3456 TaxID=546901 RepID=UPI001AEDB167
SPRKSACIARQPLAYIVVKIPMQGEKFRATQIGKKWQWELRFAACLSAQAASYPEPHPAKEEEKPAAG